MELEFPIIVVATVERTNFPVCFGLSHLLSKLTHNFFSYTVLINQGHCTHFHGIIKKGT